MYEDKNSWPSWSRIESVCFVIQMSALKYKALLIRGGGRNHKHFCPSRAVHPWSKYFNNSDLNFVSLGMFVLKTLGIKEVFSAPTFIAKMSVY